MANLAFTPADYHVLLIFPSEPPPFPYQHTLATSAGRPLHIIQGTPLPGQARDYRATFVVEPDRRRECLQQIVARL